MVKTYSSHLPHHYIDVVKQYLQALEVKHYTMECDKLVYIEFEIEENNSKLVNNINSFITSLEVFETKVKKNG